LKCLSFKYGAIVNVYYMLVVMTGLWCMEQSFLPF